MVYPDSIPVDTFYVSVKSLQKFILILFQLKTTQDLCWFSLNRSIVYPDSVTVDTFYGSVLIAPKIYYDSFPVKF